VAAFDVIAGAILLASAALGFIRGATREVVTVLAFVLGIVVAIFALRISAPLARHVIHTDWLAHAAALLAVFLIVYIAVRLAGGVVTRGVRLTVLSGPDRLLGLLIGAVRGLVAIGCLVLAIHVATPPERTPHWLTDARLYPIADAAGSALRQLAPRGLGLVRKVAPSMGNALDPSLDGTENAETSSHE
jgi:membrane protein required for colicin V production